MKRRLQIILACLLFGVATQAQVIITGVMYDPAGTDGRTTADGAVTGFKGGGEYVQLMATETIDFSETPYAVIFNRNPGSTVTLVTNGWASGGDRTYQFSLTSGAVTKGEIFYVGGLDQYVGGYVKYTDGGSFTADMSGKKWIGAKNYVSNAGDNGVGTKTSGIIANSGNPTGIGVFNTDKVTNTIAPIDVVFISDGIGAGSKKAVLANYTADPATNANGPGYLLPYRNDLHDWNGGAALYFGVGKRTNATAAYQTTTDVGNFLMLGGVYNTDTKRWVQPRSGSYINMVPSKDAAGAIYAADPARVAEIEGVGTTQLVSGASPTTPAPIIISGFMMDPQGADAPAVGAIEGTTSYIHKGGYEYIQLMATQDIDFTQNPYSFVYCLNGGATDGAPANGWAETNSIRTFKFNITSGTVSRGEYFYVGGPEKAMGGYLTSGSNYYPVGDLSGAKWMRTITYSTGDDPAVAVGDDNIGLSNGGLMINASEDTSNQNPTGFAVFKGTSIDKNTIPVDAVFVWYNPMISADHQAVYKGSNYYTVPVNDFFDGGYVSHDGNNQAVIVQPTANVGYFYKLGGVYNTNTQTWDQPRVSNGVQLVPPSAYGNEAVRTDYAKIKMLEGDLAGYENDGGVAKATTLYPSPTLPVKLTSFTAKKQQSSVVLNWQTASEENNSHFNILRSGDGNQFENIAKINTIGNSHTVKNYTATDFHPLAGNNYYRLTQTDQDGSAKMIGNTVVSYDFNTNSLVTAQQGSKISLSINVQINESATILVSNMQGRKLSEFKTSLKSGNNSVEINKELSAGIYIATVILSKQQLTTKFVVK